jgi:hypothetical protein
MALCVSALPAPPAPRSATHLLLGARVRRQAEMAACKVCELHVARERTESFSTASNGAGSLTVILRACWSKGTRPTLNFAFLVRCRRAARRHRDQTGHSDVALPVMSSGR